MSESLPPELLAQAAQGNRRAIESILTDSYPRVWRIAHGLCSDHAAASGVVKSLLRRSLEAMPKWESSTEAENWFLHHAVLQSRQAAISGASWPWANSAGPDVMAFLKTFAALPFQQREVFLLRHGENLDPRQTAIAMDCSTTAAANHLNAATQLLRTLSGLDYERLLAQLIATYQNPPPPGNLVIANTTRAAARRLLLRRLRRVFLLLLLAAGIWIAWEIYRRAKL